MNEENILKLKNVELLEKYAKTVFLIDFYTTTWMRWMGLLDNAATSVETLDNLIDSLKNNTYAELLENYKEYYEDAFHALDEKTEDLVQKIVIAEKRKSLLFAEICRRNINFEISKYREIIENRIKYYKACMEEDL